jgi:hypothetical protein
MTHYAAQTEFSRMLEVDYHFQVSVSKYEQEYVSLVKQFHSTLPSSDSIGNQPPPVAAVPALSAAVPYPHIFAEPTVGSSTSTYSIFRQSTTTWDSCSY